MDARGRLRGAAAIARARAVAATDSADAAAAGENVAGILEEKIF